MLNASVFRQLRFCDGSFGKRHGRGLGHMSENVLLRGDDVARRLQCSRSAAYRLMRSGELPVVRLGNLVRVRPEALEEFILRQERPAAEPTATIDFRRRAG